MIKIINTILSVFKMFLLLICFVFSFFIIINMYRRLEKDMFDAIFNFIPFVLLFILFAVNFVLKQKSVNSCIFYNVTCCLVFLMIIFAAFRTFTDQNMVLIIRLGYDINFNYFADIIAPMRAMLYMLCVSNVLLMIDGLDFNKLEKKLIEEPAPKAAPKKKKNIELKPANKK